MYTIMLFDHLTELFCSIGVSSVEFPGFAVGESPSGKAPGFGPGIRGFESLLPSHLCHVNKLFTAFVLGQMLHVQSFFVNRSTHS